MAIVIKPLIYFTVFDYFNMNKFDAHLLPSLVLSEYVNFLVSRVYKENETQISSENILQLKSRMEASS